MVSPTEYLNPDAIDSVSATYQGWLGSRSDQSNTSFVVWFHQDSTQYDLRVDYEDFTIMLTDTSIEIENQYNIYIDSNKIKVNNDEYIMKEHGDFQSPTTLTLFGVKTYNSSGSLNDDDSIDRRLGRLRLYSCQIWDGNTLIRDFVPCYRKSDNEVGLYDIVNDVFYTNRYRLTDAYMELDYIESSGTQYIETDIYPNQNTGIEFVADALSASENEGWFGGRTSGFNNSFVLWKLGNNFRLDYNEQYNNFSEMPITENTTYTITIDKNISTINNDRVTFDSSNNFKSSASITLFGIKTYSSINPYNDEDSVDIRMASIRLRSCKIWSNNRNTLLRDYIPCYRIFDHQAGLYDKVSRRFFPNCRNRII